MRLARILAIVAIGAAAGRAVAAPDAGPPPEEALLALAERGRTIAIYLQAVERTRARLQQQPGEVAEPQRMIALPGRDGWRVLLIKEGEGPAQKGPKIMAEVGYSPDAEEVGALRAMVPPHPATAAIVAHLRALEAAAEAVARVPGARPPFDEAVVRESDGAFSVYLMSRPGTAAAVRFGGDFLARVARTGRQVESIDPLHAGEPIDVPAGGRAPGEPTLHHHAPGDLPAPTDVARVMVRPGVAPHLAMTAHSMFRIDARGVVTYLGVNRVPPPAPGGRP